MPGAEPIRFNPFSPDFRADPHPTYHRLRAEDPVHRSHLGMWVLTRYEDVVDVLGDLRFSSRQIPEMGKQQAAHLEAASLEAVELLGNKAIVFTDRPEHTRLRRLVGKCFTAKNVEAWGSAIHATAGKLLSNLAEAREVEFMAGFADPFPLHVISDAMDLPQEIRGDVSAWAHDVRFLLEPGLLSPRRAQRVTRTLLEAMAYFRGVLAARRERPGSDLISSFARAEDGQDRLTDDEVVIACIMTFVAGHETTKCLLGNGLLALLAHPDQMHALRRSPELIDAAVDEMLRYDPPLQQTMRKALEDVDLGGRRIEAGDRVLLCLGAANRDPEIFEAPDHFRIGREERRRHLGFGQGMHRCIGEALAMLEVRVAFAGLLERFERIQLLDDHVVGQDQSMILRGPRAFRITVA